MLGLSYPLYQLYSALIKPSQIILRIVAMYYQFLHNSHFFISVHKFLLAKFYFTENNKQPPEIHSTNGLMYFVIKIIWL